MTTRSLFVSTLFISAVIGTACSKKEKPQPAETAAPAAPPVGSAPPSEPTPPTPAPSAATPPAAGSAQPLAPSPLGPPPADMDPKLASACEGGDVKACMEATRPITFGSKTLQKMKVEQRAAYVRYALRACDLGEAKGCSLATLSPDKATSRAAQDRACTLGELGECGDLGWGLYVESNDPKTPRVVELLEKACRGNAIGAQGPEPGKYCWYLVQLLEKTEPAKAKEFEAVACKQSSDRCTCKSDADCDTKNGLKCTNEGLEPGEPKRCLPPEFVDHL